VKCRQLVFILALLFCFVFTSCSESKTQSGYKLKAETTTGPSTADAGGGSSTGGEGGSGTASTGGTTIKIEIDTK
jgi:hypothetical protein